jgi:hypothetical protein
MKFMSIIGLLLTILFSSTAFTNDGDTSNFDPSQAAAVQDVIGQVKDALSDAQTDLAKQNLKSLPALSKVDLDLQTVIAKKAGATFQFWIISIGGTWEKDRSQELDISLVPPNPGNPKQISTASLTQSMVQAIESAAHGVSGAGDGSIPLKTSSVVIKISFTVKLDGSAGAKTPELLPITADVSGDLSKTAVQTLTLTFGSAPKKDGAD